MNKDEKKYLSISIICFVLGSLFVANQKNWLVLRLPNQSSKKLQHQKYKYAKKNVQLFFWYNNRWNSEKVDIIWGNDPARNISNLVNNWLNVLEEEKVTKQKVSLQSTLVPPSSQTAYLSFDQSLFDNESSTHKKLMLIEGLLKTIKNSDLKIPLVQFLTHHQPMGDSHLDMNHPWPINGFLD